MICIVLQYHGGDYFRAMELARFIARIEPKRRDDVLFMFFGRWDAAPPDGTTLELVRQKFDAAFAQTSKYRWHGWPAGPNGIAREAMGNAATWLPYYFGGAMANVEALLLIEPDVTPFARDWIDQMIDDWKAFGVSTENPGGVWQIGAWRDSGGPGGHINGNCLIRVDIARTVPLQVITPHVAWDCAIAPLMRGHWYDSWLFRNDFQGVNATLERLRRPIRGEHPPVLIHGYKDDSALKLARNILL